MATQTILIDIPETGLNLTAQVDVVGGSSFASSVDVVESGSLAGRYSFTLSNSSGQYRVELTDDDDSNSLLAVLYVETTNTAASFYAVDELLLLDVYANTSGESVDVASLSAEAIAQLAGTVVRLAPTEQLEAASLDLVKGADYSAADGTDIRWTVDTADDLTGSSAVLILKRGSASTQFSGTVSNVSGTTWRISIDIDSAEISDLVAANDWTYTLNLVLASSSVRNVRKPGQRARILSAT
jgi:hypothetical protein